MKNENIQQGPQINPSQYGYPMPYQQEDEIDLYELWSAIWQRKQMIFFVSLMVALIAFAYVLMVKPIYKAEIFFLPPLAQDIQELNFQGIQDMDVASIARVSPEKVYQEFQKNLQSKSLRREFYEKPKNYDWFQKANNLDNSDVQQTFEDKFDEKLKVKVPKTGSANFISLSFEAEDKELSATWLNSYVDFVVSKTRHQLVIASTTELKNNKQFLLDKVAGLRKIALSRRKDRIALLQESLLIAKMSGNTDPVKLRGSDIDKEYMRGSKAIESEINVLQSRKNEDPFIEGIRDFQEKIAYLDAISIEEKNITPVTIDQAALVPVDPIKPKKKLILLIALVLGVFMGIFIAIVQASLCKNKKLEE